jgi:hypothetical protein
MFRSLLLHPYIYTSYSSSLHHNHRLFLFYIILLLVKGESIAMVLALVGAEPIRESTGRVVAFAPIPLEVTIVRRVVSHIQSSQ